MGFAELLILAVGLSMDAFAVSICKGLSMKKAGLKEGFSTLDRCRRVPFRMKNLGHYLRIEWELVYNTFIYAYEYAKRRKIQL